MATQEDRSLSVLFEEPAEKRNSPYLTNDERIVGQVEPNHDFVVEKSELTKAQESD